MARTCCPGRLIRVHRRRKAYVSIELTYDDEQRSICAQVNGRNMHNDCGKSLSTARTEQLRTGMEMLTASAPNVSIFPTTSELSDRGRPCPTLSHHGDNPVAPPSQTQFVALESLLHSVFIQCTLDFF